jgi:hypothetical protein
LAAAFAERAGRFSFDLVITPIFEHLEVFQRVGESTDVVRNGHPLYLGPHHACPESVARVDRRTRHSQRQGRPVCLRSGRRRCARHHHSHVWPRDCRWYDRDHLGSVRMLTDNAGAPIATFTYDAYGQPAGQTGTQTTPFGLAGEYRDSETGFTYLRAPTTTRTPANSSHATPSRLSRDLPTGM